MWLCRACEDNCVAIMKAGQRPSGGWFERTDVGRYEDGRVQLEGLVGGARRMGASGTGRGVSLPFIISL
jgi:hypothetical protein